MGKKSSAPAPQPVAQIPQAPTFSQNIKEYIDNYPQLFSLQEQYGPKEAQLGLDLLKQFGPQYDAYESAQQKELTPYTFGLQEQLAKLASENATSELPNALRDSYLDQFRAEVGPNAGSGIAGDYISNNLARASEQYRNYYQNLGLSLINRVPVSSTSPANPQFSNPVGNFGLSELQNYNANTYGNYVQGLTSVPYYVPGGKRGGFNTSGALMGGIGGAMYGGGLPGAIGGGIMGGFF